MIQQCTQCFLVMAALSILLSTFRAAGRVTGRRSTLMKTLPFLSSHPLRHCVSQNADNNKEEEALSYDDFFGIEEDCAWLQKHKWKPGEASGEERAEPQPFTPVSEKKLSEDSEDYENEIVLTTNFGTVRLDRMNPVLGSVKHVDTRADDADASFGLIDEQYFRKYTRCSLDEVNTHTDDSRTPDRLHKLSTECNNDPGHHEASDKLKLSCAENLTTDNFFDQQIMNNSNWSAPSSRNVSTMECQIANQYDVNESNGLSHELNANVEEIVSAKAGNMSQDELDELNYFDLQLLEQSAGPRREPSAQLNVGLTKKQDRRKEIKKKSVEETKIVTECVSNTEDIVVEELPLRTKLNRSLPLVNLKNPQTAYDLSRKIRAEEIEFTEPTDSKGFRVLKNETTDFSKEPKDVVANILRNSVIYNDHDIVAIDKPYGIATQGGPNAGVSIDDLLERLARLLDKKEGTLYQIHRLDKNTTGVMLFAKTKSMQTQLIEMMRDHKIKKRYWALTRGVPTPLSGVIDIPMVEGTVDGRYRMVLKPEDRHVRLIEKKSSLETLRALTKYKVLHSNNSAALVECETMTGVKHQVRCHLGFGLNCAVLGDHKYSHFNKLAPQRLFADTLQHLGIRQAKVRHLPMHLHAKSIYLPNIIDGRNVLISTRLPKHFVRTMQRLKIKPPSSS